METLKKNNFTDYTISIIEPWIKYLETIRGFGTHTLNAYKRDVLDFLKLENEKLRNELDKITSSLDKLGKGRMMKKSDLSNLYDE